MHRLVFTLLCSLFVISALGKYDDDSRLYVHLIPHTHDDFGWLKTVEEYYYGIAGSGFQDLTGIQYIIEEVLGELAVDPEKRFSWVEVGYFYRYWMHQDASVRENVKKLAQEGRLEFLNGGWAMHDEAVVYYEDMIDNMALGQKFLHDNFGVVPTIGWQIDPFGHSSTNAALFSKMGIDAFWMARIDREEKEIRKAQQNLEFIWQPRTSQDDENQVLAIVTAEHYDFPEEFCFDLHCIHRQPPVVDDETTHEYNVDTYASRFADYVNSKLAPFYKHNHVFFMMGGDFAFEIASMPFANFAKIKNYINKHADKFNMEVMYSTPSEYVEAVHSKELNLTKNQADFFPYSDDYGQYWSGYYSSRNRLKKLVRNAGKELQNVRRLFTYSLWRGEVFDQAELDSIWKGLDLMERKQAELQHHDAVTGTSKQHVADDYANVLSHARGNLHEVYNI